jgi:type IV pilus assembly protein PilM
MKADEREKDESRGGNYKPVWKGEAGQGAWVVEIRGYTDFEKGQQLFRDALVKNLQRSDDFVKGDKKIDKLLAGVPDPVKGKISHVFMYSYKWMDPNGQGSAFKFINQSSLDKVLGGNASAQTTGVPTMAGMPASGSDPMGMGSGAAAATPAASLSAPWKPVTGATSSGTGMYGTPGTTFPSSSVPPGMGGMSEIPGMVPMPGTTTVADAGGSARRRWEFSVMLIWREPIPSGSGTPKEAGADTPTPATGMPPR